MNREVAEVALFALNYLANRGVNMARLIEKQNIAKAQGRELTIEDLEDLSDQVNDAIDQI